MLIGFCICFFAVVLVKYQYGTQTPVLYDVLDSSIDISRDEKQNIVWPASGIEVKKDDWLLLSLHGINNIKKINIDSVGKQNVTIINTDGIGRKVYDAYDLQDAHNIDAAYVKIIFQEPCILKNISVYGKSAVKEYLQRNTDVIASATDEKNPLYVYRIPLRAYLYDLADDVLGDQKSNLSDHEKIVKFMEYVQSYRIGGNNAKSRDLLTDWVTSKIGACGDYSNVTAALAYTQGIETRLLTMGNYPKGSGHACLEAKIDGKWRFYDPTYALYYVRKLDDAGNIDVLSFDELCRGAGKAVEVEKVIGSSNHIAGDFSYDYMGPEIYELAEPIGVVSPHIKLFYPINIDYHPNESYYMNQYQGGTYLGAACINNCWKVNIKGVEPYKRYAVNIYGKGIGGECLEPMEIRAWSLQCLIEKGADYVWQGIKNEKWSIGVLPYSESIEFYIENNETGDKFHYENIDRIEIIEY